MTFRHPTLLSSIEEGNSELNYAILKAVVAIKETEVSPPKSLAIINLKGVHNFRLSFALENPDSDYGRLLPYCSDG